MTVYLQSPGDIAIPLPHPEISGALDLGAAEHRALSGARTVDYVGSPRRTYTFARSRLSAENWSTLEDLALGGQGEPGPLILHDPWRRNMLTANQASTGNVLRSTEGVVTNGVTISLNGPFDNNDAARGRYVWGWQLPASGAANVNRLEFKGAASLGPDLTPVVGGLPYTFQLKVAQSGGTSQSVQAGIYWLDAALVLLAGSVGTGANPPAGLPAGTTPNYSVTATAPASAAYCWPWIGNTNTQTATAPFLFVDAPMFAQASAVQNWTMGTGVPKVAFTDMGETYHPGSTRDGQFTLVEVG